MFFGRDDPPCPSGAGNAHDSCRDDATPPPRFSRTGPPLAKEPSLSCRSSSHSNLTSRSVSFAPSRSTLAESFQRDAPLPFLRAVGEERASGPSGRAAPRRKALTFREFYDSDTAAGELVKDEDDVQLNREAGGTYPTACVLAGVPGGEQGVLEQLEVLRPKFMYSRG